MAFSTYLPLQIYPADGVQVDFAVPDLFYDTDDVRAVVVEDGREILKFQGIDFSVLVVGRETTPPFRQQGVVRFVVPPVGPDKVVVFILPTAVQDQKFEGRAVTPRQHERVHDREMQIISMLLEFFNRSYRSTLDTPPGLRTIVAGREGYVPTWDEDGNLVEGPTVGQINQVVAIIPQINAVAAIVAQVTAVANIDAETVIVAGLAAHVAALGPRAAAISALAPYTDELQDLAPLSAHIAALGPIAADILAVSGIKANVNTVAGKAAQIQALVDNQANIDAVAGNAGNINAAVANAPNINNVAGNKPNIDAVAGALPILIDTAAVLNAVVRKDQAQSNTAPQKLQARNNIGAVGSDMTIGGSNRLIRSSGTTNQMVKDSPIIIGDDGAMSGIKSLSVDGAMARPLRGWSSAVQGTTYATTAIGAFVQAGGASYVPSTPTSLLLVMASVLFENERSTGTTTEGMGGQLMLRRWSGSDYLAISGTITTQSLVVPTPGGVHRQTIPLFAVLGPNDRRSDNGQWTVATFFSNGYSGNTARVTAQHFVFLEFEQ